MSSVTIINYEAIGQDGAPLLQATLQRLAQHQHVKEAHVYCAQRKDSGWLEYGLDIQYEPSGRLFIGCIQRQPGEPFEFHS